MPTFTTYAASLMHETTIAFSAILCLTCFFLLAEQRLRGWDYNRVRRHALKAMYWHWQL